MRVINCEQGTPEWKEARAGKVTASGVKSVLAQIKSGEAAARRDYRVQIVTELLTGEPVEDGFFSKDMEWGKEQEPMARARYEVEKDVLVDTVGFVLHPTIARAGASPDGVIGWAGGDPEGLVEIKCPKRATHLAYILEGRVPTDYQPQMLWQMACTGAKWCDFVSYDPRFPEHLQLFVVRFHRDEKRIAEITKEVLAFLEEVQQVLDRLAPPPGETVPPPKPTTTRGAATTAPPPAPDPGALERHPEPQAAVFHGGDGGPGEEALPL